MTKTIENIAGVKLTGKSAAKRIAAFNAAAPLMFVAEASREEVIANMRVALGNRPTDAQLKAYEGEIRVGHIASRLSASMCPKGCTSEGAKLEHARNLLFHYAMPVKAGAKARKLRKGQLGRRTEAQQKLVHASTEAWSRLKGDSGYGVAKSGKERSEAKRNATHARQLKEKAKVVPEAEMPSVKSIQADDVAQFLLGWSANGSQYCKKYAAKVPTSFNRVAELVEELRTEALKAGNAYEEAKARALAAQEKAKA